MLPASSNDWGLIPLTSECIVFGHTWTYTLCTSNSMKNWKFGKSVATYICRDISAMLIIYSIERDITVRIRDGYCAWITTGIHCQLVDYKVFILMTILSLANLTACWTDLSFSHSEFHHAVSSSGKETFKFVHI